MRHQPRRRRRNQPLVLALYVNAALLAGILIVVAGRSGGAASTALAAAPGPINAPQPIAGGNGMYLMPAQFSQFIWGCYVMDTDKKVLTAYEYVPSNRMLRLAAVRPFAQDLDLGPFNTTPSPAEVQKMIDMQKAGVRGQPVPPGGVAPQPPASAPVFDEPETRPAGPTP